MIIIFCPNCGNQDIEEVEYRYFKCEKCGEKFELGKTRYEECQYKIVY